MLHLKVCMVVGLHRLRLSLEKEYCSNSLDLRLNTSQVVCIAVKILGGLFLTLLDLQ